jgi:hypothetical protein
VLGRLRPRALLVGRHDQHRRVHRASGVQHHRCVRVRLCVRVRVELASVL